MMNDPPRAARLALRGTLLALAMLTTAAAAAVLGFAAYLLAEGYSGGGGQQGVAPLAFPLSFLVLAVAGLPLTLACAACWASYLKAARRHRQPSR